jgi:hypothetical protein
MTMSKKCIKKKIEAQVPLGSSSHCQCSCIDYSKSPLPVCYFHSTSAHFYKFAYKCCQATLMAARCIPRDHARIHTHRQNNLVELALLFVILFMADAGAACIEPRPAGRLGDTNVYTIFQQKIKSLMLFFVRALLMRLLFGRVFARALCCMCICSFTPRERLILHMLKPSS